MAKVRSVDLGSSFLPSIEGACEVLFVRHGEQAFVANMALVDGVDAPLTELGQQQAAAVGDRLAAADIDAVYTSTMQRARNTGLAIAGHHDLEITEDHSLREIHLWEQLPQDKGIIESLGEDELRRIMRAANRSRRWDSYPHGENRDAFRERVVTAVEKVIASHLNQRVVIACHGGVINAYLAHVMESDLDTVSTVHHTSITTVRAMDDLRRVVQVNNFEHVRPLQTSINPINAA
ncbi:MAG: putative phosphoglycerate mutase [Candidatus Aldehydirespiratoraceae bacterium]|jgi:probable phosphoglycerate mutase